MTMIADTSRIRSVLDWTPQYDDLETIAAHALAWEEKLFRERHGEQPHAVSAYNLGRR
jgi:UDP-glucose 4-epimerase